MPQRNFDGPRVKLAIIGLGSIGAKHLLLNRQSSLDNSKEIEIHALKRTNSTINKSYLDMIDCLYDNLDDMVKTNYDYAIISSPSSFHSRILQPNCDRDFQQRDINHSYKILLSYHELSISIPVIQ